MCLFRTQLLILDDLAAGGEMVINKNGFMQLSLDSYIHASLDWCHRAADNESLENLVILRVGELWSKNTNTINRQRDEATTDDLPEDYKAPHV